MKLYHAPQTRSFRILWMLEELGVAYEIERVDLASKQQKSDAYRAINPMGKVPALVDGGVVVTESAAICTYLADRFPEQRLAPPVGSAERGPYLRWLFFSAGCIEPAFAEQASGRHSDPFRVAWGSFDEVVETLCQALRPGPYLLGDWFTAADVMVGSGVQWGTITKLLPARPELTGYVDRISKRPALERAFARDDQAARTL